MTEFARFMTARLDEDERIALATTVCPVAGSWRPAQEKNSEEGSPLALIQGREEIDAEDYIGYSWGNPVIVHAAERRILARHDPEGSDHCWNCVIDVHIAYGSEVIKYAPHPCPDLRDLAAPYDGHPDFKEGWQP